VESRRGGTRTRGVRSAGIHQKKYFLSKVEKTAALLSFTPRQGQCPFLPEPGYVECDYSHWSAGSYFDNSHRCYSHLVVYGRQKK